MADPYAIASQLLGRGEVPDQALIQDYLENGGVNLDPVETAWCAGFMNSTLAQAGQKGTGSNMARSFLDWGRPVSDPQKGDVAVFKRGDPNGPYGHVGLFDGYNPDGSIRVLGGNQGDKVSVASFSKDDLLGFRRGETGNALATPPFFPEERQNALASLDAPTRPSFGQGNDSGGVDIAGAYSRGRENYLQRQARSFG